MYIDTKHLLSGGENTADLDYLELVIEVWRLFLTLFVEEGERQCVYLVCNLQCLKCLLF